MHEQATLALGTAAPNWPVKQLIEQASQFFSVTGEAHVLGGERDQNICMIDNMGQKIVVKLSGPEEEPSTLEFQSAIMRHVARAAPEIDIPRVISANNGSDLVELIDQDGRKHFLRVYTFLSGETVETLGTDYVDGHKAGHFVGRLSTAMAGFHHPNAYQDIAWNLMSSVGLRREARHIRDTDRRRMVEIAWDIFMRHGISGLSNLRSQVIHNDLTQANLMADPTRPGDITGAIDFGDSTYGPMILDPAITAVKLAEGRANPIGFCADVFAGFAAERSILLHEAELAFPAMMGRIALTQTIQAWREVHAPEKASELAADMGPSLENLERYLCEGLDRVTKTFADAIGIPAVSCKIAVPLEKDRDPQKLLARRKKVLSPALHLTYQRPIYAVRADGLWIYDENGKPHLDAYNNVPHVGHAHPKVAEAINRNARLINTNTRYLYDEVIEHAERLTEKTSDQLDVVVFCNSGSEATDIAWRISKAWQGRTGGLVMEDAYHGCTDATADLSPFRWPKGYVPSHIGCLENPDTYRGRFGLDDLDAGQKYAEDVDRKVADLEAKGHQLASSVICTAFCTNGMPDLPPGYYANVAERTRAHGGLVIADEVQYGFGRPGSHFWGYEMYDVEPDMVVLGKPVANGMPLGAVILRSDILKHFRDSQHLFATFGGNPVVTGAALAVMDVLEEEQLQENAYITGAQLKAGLQGLAEKYDRIGRVSGSGLFAIVDVVKSRESKEHDPDLASRVQNAMREDGVLVGMEGKYDNFLKIRPPMPFASQHCEMLLDSMDRAFKREIFQ